MKQMIKMMALSVAALGMSVGAAVAEPLKVGFLYLTTPGDHGWTYAHELARQEVQAHFGDKVETTFVENVPEGPDAERVVRELARQGNKVIFGTSFGYMDPMLKVSKEFPDVKFEHITGYKRSGNMATGNIRFYEGRYVQGIVAGMMTKTNKIGYIAPFPIPEAYQGLNAFAIGMREANPDAEIMVIWANTWADPVKEADAAKVLVAQGADVMAQHTDTPAMLQTAEKAGIHGFGQASDMKDSPRTRSSSPRSMTGRLTTSRRSSRCWTVAGRQAMARSLGRQHLEGHGRRLSCPERLREHAG